MADLANYSVARIILAAGAGSRMGQNKALMDICGQSALSRIAARSLLGSNISQMSTYVVVGHEAELVGQEASSLGLEVVANSKWQTGQTSSLKAGIRAAQMADLFLLHPVDLPLIEQDDYRALSMQIESSPGHTMYVTSDGSRRGHPLVFSSDFAKQVLLLNDDDSLRNVTRKVEDIIYAQVTNPWIRQDLDHPSDLEAARRYLSDKG